jgi:hypothetical protein
MFMKLISALKKIKNIGDSEMVGVKILSKIL